MDKNQFEEAKKVPQYHAWMDTVLGYDNLTMEDYKKFMEHAFMSVYESKEKNPIVILEQAIEIMRKKWTASNTLPFHGPWHHGMVPAILMRALKNNGAEIEDWQIHEAFERGMMIPGGGCGFCGICGAGSGLGIVLSLILKSNPFLQNERSESLKASAKVIEKIGKLGGVRCCRLSSYITIDTAVKELEKFGYHLPTHEVVSRCKVHSLNPDCHGEKCPYFPKI